MEKPYKLTTEIWTGLNIELSNIIMFHAFHNEKLNAKIEQVDTIYHYTSLHGLVSIIENQSLFCTNINFLNDKQEYRHGVNLILEVIDKLKNDVLEIEILNMVENNINRIYREERYVTCFSKDGDLLSQWRAYTNQGKGVSIGFDMFKLEKSLDQPLHGKYIDYDEKSQIETIEELIRIIINYFSERKIFFDWDEYSYEWLVNTTIVDFLQGIISSYKNNSFSEEQEYRLEYVIDGNMIKKEDEEVHFRTSDSLIIPYLILETKYKRFLKDKEAGKFKDAAVDPTFLFKRLPIKEITIGPSLDFGAISSGLEQLLSKHEYEDVHIKKSSIPYRI